jgi:hypothetical protein
MSVNAPTPTAPRPGETPAQGNDAAEVNMTVVWSIVAFVVLVVGGFATPWDTISSLLENGGPSDDQQSVLAFVAGYTFPLTIATGGLVYAALAGWFDEVEWPWHLVIGGGVLFAAGVAAQEFGLGLLPAYTLDVPGGPPYISLPLWVLQGYFNSYGGPLMICSAAIGAGAALQLRDWLNS